VIRVLGYCGFLERNGVVLPENGVDGAPVNVLAENGLRVLWSDVNWPFDANSLQRHAIEFHRVVHHVFAQTAVVPFRLLSLFENKEELRWLLQQNRGAFSADLERLAGLVQMECVSYFVPQREEREATSGMQFMKQKAGMWKSLEEYSERVQDALATISRGVRIREVKYGRRLFVLVERGCEQQFRETVQGLPLPAGMKYRTSGPWPAAEFLSDSVKAPQVAGKR